MIRRSVARQLCDAGRVKVNGVRVKASKEVKPGDEIEIARGDRRTAAKVLALPSSKQVSKSAAADLVELTVDERQSDPLLP